MSKQTPGTYKRFNPATQDYEERQNRAYRRMNLAKLRRVNKSYKAQWRANRRAQTYMASAIYSKF